MINSKINNHAITSTHKFNDTVILNSNINYPFFQSDTYKDGIAKINIYFQYKMSHSCMEVQNTTVPLALESLNYTSKNYFPFVPYEYDITYKITLNNICILSMYIDTYEFNGGAHGNTTRESYSFNLKNETILSLYDIVKTKDPEKYVLDQIEQIINETPDYQESIFSFDMVVDSFDPKNFYLTPDELIIYYPLYSIAPYSAGIITFSLPYNKILIKPSCT